MGAPCAHKGVRAQEWLGKLVAWWLLMLMGNSLWPLLEVVDTLRGKRQVACGQVWASVA